MENEMEFEKHRSDECWASTDTLTSTCLDYMIRISEREVAFEVLRLKMCSANPMPSHPHCISTCFIFSRFLYIPSHTRNLDRAPAHKDRSTSYSSFALNLDYQTCALPKIPPNLGLLHLRLQNSSKSVLQVLGELGILLGDG
jgi:hypothetical protein